SHLHSIPTRRSYHLAFVILKQEGEDLTSLTTIDRKERLATLLGDSDSKIRFSEHIIGSGEKLFIAMCKAGKEGIISNRVNAPYRNRRKIGRASCRERE